MMVSSVFKKIVPALLALAFVSVLHAASENPQHTFAIGPKDFLLDGKPFVIRCGEIHFPRVPRAYWKHRLEMCKAMGLNAVCVYLFWNFHEPEPGRFNWSGQADAAEFCRLAQEEGLWVILRPGPYSCAEWEMGGLPWWLLKDKDIALRSRAPKFLDPALDYIKEVGRVLGPLQITHGGPILMTQVENEYGWFGNDVEYMGILRKAFIEAGFDVPLFQCDPPNVLQNGYRSDLFQVVNFGANGAPGAFAKLAEFQKTGPLMNGEYYPGWFDSWGSPHRLGPVESVLGDLDFMLKNHHSFSIYMAHGGTSFGLWAGACTDNPFMPVCTSYDYDAPISEAGWVTLKFKALRELFSKYLQPGETIPEPPPANPIIEIPPFTLAEVAPLAMNLPTPKSDSEPGTMEDYDESHGLILYHTTVPGGLAGTLAVKAAHDFAWIFLDGRTVGVMDRRTNHFQVTLPARNATARLDILVDAMGRVNFGHGIADRKGLLAPVTFTPTRGSSTDLTGWQIYPLPLGDQPPASLKYVPAPPGGAAPAFWRGSFTVGNPGDTFLDMRNWGKGIVWVNGHCLGRFWDIGPTQTMYLPGPWLNAGRNDIVIFDIIGPRNPKLDGLAKPILDELHPELDLEHLSRAHGTFSTQGIMPAGRGTFTPDVDWQTCRFSTSVNGRYLCFQALSANDGKPLAAVAELEALDSAGNPLSRTAWKIIWADSEESAAESGAAENLIDGDPATHWHTEYSQKQPGFPHEFVIDMGQPQSVGGIRYLPRAGRPTDGGRVKDCQVFVSDMPFGLTLLK